MDEPEVPGLHDSGGASPKIPETARSRVDAESAAKAAPDEVKPVAKEIESPLTVPALAPEPSAPGAGASSAPSTPAATAIGAAADALAASLPLDPPAAPPAGAPPLAARPAGATPIGATPAATAIGAAAEAALDPKMQVRTQPSPVHAEGTPREPPVVVPIRGAAPAPETQLRAFTPPSPTRVDGDEETTDRAEPDTAADPPPEAAADHPPEPPPIARRRLVALAVAVGVPAFLVGVALAAHRPIVRRIVLQRATSMGIELAFDDLDVSLGSVRLSNVRASLAGVHGVRVTADAITLTTSRLSVESTSAERVHIALEGPATDRILELAAWSGEHDGTLRLPGNATNVRLDWRARPDGPAWLTLTGGTLTGDGTNGQLTANAVAFGVPAGTVAASVAVDAAGVTLEAGKKQGAPPLTASLRTIAQPHTLSIKLRPIDAVALGEALGVAMPSRGTTISGQADLTLGKAGSTGTATLDIDGWTPAHPKSLDGFVFGRKTTLKTRLTLSEDRASATFEDLELHAGRLALKGGGTMAADGARTLLHLDLGGTIPCSDIARGSASKELPGFLGDLFGEVAGRAVGGSARVNVTLDADARNLAAAKITPKVSVGCALKLPGL